MPSSRGWTRRPCRCCASSSSGAARPWTASASTASSRLRARRCAARSRASCSSAPSATSNATGSSRRCRAGRPPPREIASDAELVQTVALRRRRARLPRLGGVLAAAAGRRQGDPPARRRPPARARRSGVSAALRGASGPPSPAAETERNDRAVATTGCGRGAVALLFFAVASACAGGSRPFYDAGEPPFVSPKGFSLQRRAAALGGRTPAHRLILIGDAGATAPGDATLADLGRWSADLPDRTTVAFLGDNLYPSGLGEDDERGASVLLRQLRATPARKIFVPGNHDWGDWQLDAGRLVNEERFIDGFAESPAKLLPEGRLPRPGTRDPGRPGRRPRAGRSAAGDRPRLVADRRRRAARLRRHRERGRLRERPRAHAACARRRPRGGGCAPSAAHWRTARRLGPRLRDTPAREPGRRARHRRARPRRQGLPLDARSELRPALAAEPPLVYAAGPRSRSAGDRGARHGRHPGRERRGLGRERHDGDGHLRHAVRARACRLRRARLLRRRATSATPSPATA